MRTRNSSHAVCSLLSLTPGVLVDLTNSLRVREDVSLPLGSCPSRALGVSTRTEALDTHSAHVFSFISLSFLTHASLNLAFLFPFFTADRRVSLPFTMHSFNLYCHPTATRSGTTVRGILRDIHSLAFQGQVSVSLSTTSSHLLGNPRCCCCELIHASDSASRLTGAQALLKSATDSHSSFLAKLSFEMQVCRWYDRLRDEALSH